MRKIDPSSIMSMALVSKDRVLMMLVSN